MCSPSKKAIKINSDQPSVIEAGWSVGVNKRGENTLWRLLRLLVMRATFYLFSHSVILISCSIWSPLSDMRFPCPHKHGAGVSESRSTPVDCGTLKCRQSVRTRTFRFSSVASVSFLTFLCDGAVGCQGNYGFQWQRTADRLIRFVAVLEWTKVCSPAPLACVLPWVCLCPCTITDWLFSSPPPPGDLRRSPLVPTNGEGGTDIERERFKRFEVWCKVSVAVSCIHSWEHLFVSNQTLQEGREAEITDTQLASNSLWTGLASVYSVCVLCAQQTNETMQKHWRAFNVFTEFINRCF